jgi:excisionase family DNA binding protein
MAEQHSKDRMAVSPERVASMLDISRASVYRMIREGSLPSFVLPGDRLIRIPLEAIEKLRTRERGDAA